MRRKLILKLLVVTFPVYAAFLSNLTLSLSFAERLSDNAVNGKISYTLQNYNQRRVFRKIIEKQTHMPETLFLGASPITELEPEVTGYEDQLVLCPGTGFWVDWLGVLALYKKQGRGYPKRIVLSPFARGIVRKGHFVYLTYGHVFKDAFADFYGMRGTEKWRWQLEQIEGLIKENSRIANLFSGNLAYKVYERKEDAPHPELMSAFYPDGHMIRCQKDDARHLPADYKGEPTYIYYDADFYPEKMSEYFCDMKAFCKERGIEFVVLLPPVAQNYIDNFNASHAGEGLSVESVEEYIRELAGDSLVRGTFLSYKLGLTSEAFIDEAHIRREHLKCVWDYVE